MQRSHSNRKIAWREPARLLLEPGAAQARGRSPGRRAAFSLVEMLVTIGIAAAVITAAVIIFGAIGVSREKVDQTAVIDIGGHQFSFYEMDAGTLLETRKAPSFARRLLAEELREAFYDDLHQSIAVFVLGRPSHSTLRPTAVAWDGAGSDATPETFRNALINDPAIQNAESVFQAYENGAAPGPNSSIFLIGPSGRDRLNVRAIYEMDVVDIPATSDHPAGKYASVRRHVGDAFTSYYDVFYEDPDHDSGNTAAFSPVAVFYPENRDGSTGPIIPRPFYFFWWPDPGVYPFLGSADTSVPAGDPRQYYANMGARTSFFFAAPQFPPLQ